MSKNTCWNFFIKPWLFQQPPETKLFTSVASVRGQNLACYVSFNISYSLVLWVKIWQIFIPMRLELLKTHHCAVALSNPMGVKQDTIEWRCSANLCFCIPLKMYASLCPSSKHTRLLLLECNYLAKRLFAKFAFWICIYFASSKLTYKRRKNDCNILV